MIVKATDTAFFKAVFVTSTGSTIPARTISTHSPVTTLIPVPIAPSVANMLSPALSSMVLYGALMALSNTSPACPERIF